MRKRNEVLSNVGQGSSAGAGVVMSLEEEKRGRGHRNRLFTFFVFLTLASVLVYILLFAEYAWVFRRCFLSTFWNWSIRAQMECSEAYNHRLAMLEPRLWAPPKFVPQQKQALQHIHFTLTGALSLQPWKLALCSIQIASKNLCVDIATGNSRCTVNIWMVDTSTNANKMNQKLRRKGRPVIPHYNSTDTITEELIQLLGNQNGSLWCIRKVLASTIHPKGPNCVPLNNRARDLRRWLTVGAKNQLPEHLSDGWRMVAMAEVGGLYLDTDVLVFSDKVFELPSPTVPTQHKVGAYRLNGGLLRMEPESAYLQSLIQDTLEWAPKLERLPLKDQAFGFLGPAALTRTFLNQIPNNGEKITILEPNAVEGPSPTLNCSESLAIHFTGRAWKQKWRSDGLRHESSYPECLRSFLEKQCPRQYFDEKKGGEGGS